MKQTLQHRMPASLVMLVGFAFFAITVIAINGCDQSNTNGSINAPSTPSDWNTGLQDPAFGNNSTVCSDGFEMTTETPYLWEGTCQDGALIHNSIVTTCVSQYKDLNQLEAAMPDLVNQFTNTYFYGAPVPTLNWSQVSVNSGLTLDTNNPQAIWNWFYSQFTASQYSGLISNQTAQRILGICHGVLFGDSDGASTAQKIAQLVYDTNAYGSNNEIAIVGILFGSYELHSGGGSLPGSEWIVWVADILGGMAGSYSGGPPVGYLLGGLCSAAAEIYENNN